MTDQEIEDAVRSLRRTARDVRASQQAGWLGTAMELERIADEHEKKLGHPVI